jgi:hypothetical protein
VSLELEVVNASGNLLIEQFMVEGCIFVELAAIDCANPVIDAIHTHITGSNSNDWTEATMEMISATMLHVSPSERQQPQACIWNGEMSIGDVFQSGIVVAID